NGRTSRSGGRAVADREAVGCFRDRIVEGSEVGPCAIRECGRTCRIRRRPTRERQASRRSRRRRERLVRLGGTGIRVVTFWAGSSLYFVLCALCFVLSLLELTKNKVPST